MGRGIVKIRDRYFRVVHGCRRPGHGRHDGSGDLCTDAFYYWAEGMEPVDLSADGAADSSPPGA